MKIQRTVSKPVGRLVGQMLLAASLLGGATVQAQETPAALATPVAIESVTGSIQGGVEVVKIDLSQALSAAPVGFSIQSPARIALDFAGVVSAMGRSTIDLNQGNLKSVSVAQAGDRTRVVLNLKQFTAYKTQLEGKSLLVMLEPVASAAPTAPTQIFAENLARGALPLRDLDFRRGTESTGRVVVSLPSDQVGVDIRQQGKTLVVEFMQTSLPEGLRRRLDVADFGTPVKTITTTQIGDRVRVVIEPEGLWTHSAYQSDAQFVVEVSPQKIDPAKLTQGPGYNGEKLSLNFQNIDVRTLLQVIADFTSFNVVTSDSVAGTVTLRLQDVPWDQALDIILQAKGLGVRKTGNVLWIAPTEEIIAKEKLELESKAAVLGLEPVRTQSFQMNYAKATDVAAYLAATAAGTGPNVNTSRVLSPRGSAVAEPRTNQLFVTDVPSRLEEVQQIITKLDIAVKQVLIEARIVEATDTFGRSLGVRLGGADLRAQQGGDGGYAAGGSNRVAFGTSYANVVGSSGAGGVVDLNSNFVNMPAEPIAGVPYSPAALAVSLFSSSANRFLTLELSALEADGRGKVVSSPRVVTADQKEAVIEQGREVTVITYVDGAQVKETVKGVLGLKVTPRITPDGGIIISVEVTKDTIENISPVVKTVKKVTTEILVENGGTVVIGGIFEASENEEETKVPFLGDLPGVGNLFKSRSRSSEKQELLVFITPRIIADRIIK